jgi:hypothetical protein
MAPLRIMLVCAISVWLCLAQSSKRGLASVTVHFEAHQQGFWARYLVNTRTARTPGWIVSESGEESYDVAGISPGPVSRFRGILYAPGCALQLADIAIAEAKNYSYVFPCEPVKQVEIQGVVTHPHLNEPRLMIEAKYVAAWAENFFGYDDGADTEIPLGSVATVDDQNRFRLSVPNLEKEKGGEIRIWVRDQDNGRIKDQLKVSLQTPESQRTRLGGIPMTALNSTALLFDVCSANPPAEHDKYGFALRDDLDVCQP